MQDAARFDNLMGKIGTLTNNFSPVKNYSDIERNEEAIGCIKEALTLNISGEQSGICNNLLDALEKAVEHGKNKLRYGN